jgi:hypothetical protein
LISEARSAACQISTRSEALGDTAKEGNSSFTLKNELGDEKRCGCVEGFRSRKRVQIAFVKFTARRDSALLSAAPANRQHRRRGLHRREMPERKLVGEVKDFGPGPCSHAQDSSFGGQFGEQRSYKEMQRIAERSQPSKPLVVFRGAFLIEEVGW